MSHSATQQGREKFSISSRISILALAIALAVLYVPFRLAAQSAGESAGVEARVNALLGKLSLEEKISLLGGVQSFYTVAIPHAGIPAFKMSDGPMGPRNYGPSTAFPAGIGLAATWDSAMARRMGAAMGILARARGVHFLLGPAVNIQRVPVNGRNFEYYGEDPFLAGSMTAPFVEGLQSQGVIATVKHFAANNQEYQRHAISAEVSERALHEIYLPAFKAAVQQGKAWAVMAAYNKVNGVYAAENKELLTGILKNNWGFQGVVMSDWGAAHNGISAALAGLDLEMPSAKFMNAATLLPAIRSGQVPESIINDKVRRLLRAAVSMGFFDHSQERAETQDATAQVKQVALQGAQEGIVLLKNRGAALPFDRGKIHSIAVFGPNADPAVTGGGGSSYVTPAYAISVLEGVKDVAGPAVRVDYIPFKPVNAKSPAVHLDFKAESALAAKDDAAVVCAGFNRTTESEGFDRTFGLPPGQDHLIEAVARANKKTVVILNSGGALDMTKWIGRVPAVIEAWYPGSDGGTALAQILFGDVDPSGKLPATFERRWGDSEADRNYPGADGKVFYKEGIFVGYRYFDRSKVKPLFPFGYGLSYTRFAYSDLRVTNEASDTQVVFRLRNTGRREGAEIAEVYVQELHPKVPRPVKELKGFARVDLQPGEAKDVSVTLPRSAFAYYDDSAHGWRIQPDVYRILVASSSANVRLSAKLSLQ